MKRLYIILSCLVYFSLVGQKNIHHRWNSQLQKYVSETGIVNYKSWKKDQGQLETYIMTLSQFPPSEIVSIDYKLAYWINAYNALTVKLILKYYPLNSIKEIKNPWNVKCFSTGDKEYSLGDIEHKILRKMDEPRIHFAINCASKSCPKLLNEAYTEKKIENQLNSVTKLFLLDKTKNQLNENKLFLSKIFLWFGKDFGSKKMMLEFITKYSKINLMQSKVNYLSYNWDLNE